VPTERLRRLVLLALLAAAPAMASDAAYRLQVDPAAYRVQTRPAWQLPPTPTQNPTVAARPYASAIAEAAERAGIEPELLHALVKAESGYRADAVSHKGAVGLAQLMPDTADRLDPAALTDARRNLLAGARYLQAMLERFDHTLPLALAAYNAGPGAVERHQGVPPYPETEAYVQRVLAEYEALKAARQPIPRPWQLNPAAGRSGES
jgi:soluble lytic murein transglycosylase-like protein